MISPCGGCWRLLSSEESGACRRRERTRNTAGPIRWICARLCAGGCTGLRSDHVTTRSELSRMALSTNPSQGGDTGSNPVGAANESPVREPPSVDSDLDFQPSRGLTHLPPAATRLRLLRLLCNSVCESDRSEFPSAEGLDHLYSRLRVPQSPVELECREVRRINAQRDLRRPLLPSPVLDAIDQGGT